MADKKSPPHVALSGKHPPAITLPPRSGIDMFTGAPGESPGPMTLVSSFFAANDPGSDCRSFSQLLAGGAATSSSSAIVSVESCGGIGSFTFQQRAPTGFTVSQPQEMVVIPSGMGVSNFIDWKNSSQSQAEKKIQSVYSSGATSVQEVKLLKEAYDIPGSDQKHRIVDKPTDDGFNWRKYGQKQVKGGDFPRSYYKCTHPSCPVKKKVERSLDGEITEIIYRGQHNHSPPNKRSRDTLHPESQTGNFNKLNEEVDDSIREQDNYQATLSVSSDSEEVDDSETRANDEPESKRRVVEGQTAAQTSTHRTVTEPRIVVQTTSEVDLLDDGYRWRKYGQKVVKGNPNPRSYYKCSQQGCSIRKHVERAATDPKAVITTYEGKHNHDAPTSKGSSTIQTYSNFK